MSSVTIKSPGVLISDRVVPTDESGLRDILKRILSSAKRPLPGNYSGESYDIIAISEQISFSTEQVSKPNKYVAYTESCKFETLHH